MKDEGRRKKAVRRSGIKSKRTSSRQDSSREDVFIDAVNKQYDGDTKRASEQRIAEGKSAPQKNVQPAKKAVRPKKNTPQKNTRRISKEELFSPEQRNDSDINHSIDFFGRWEDSSYYADDLLSPENLPKKEEENPAETTPQTSKKNPPARKKRTKGEKKDRKEILHLMKNSAQKHRRGVFTSLLSVVIVAALLITFEALSPIGMVDSTGLFFAGFGSSGEWPVKFEESDRASIKLLGSDIAFLTGTKIDILSRGGGLIEEIQHGYNSPSMAAESTRTIVYDRGGTEYMIVNRTGKLFSGETEQEISIADISRCGAFCIGFYEHSVQVYDRNGSAKYVKPVSGAQIVSVSLSDDGQKLAVGAVTAKNGAYLSTVSISDISSTTPLCTVEYPGSAIISVDFKDDKVSAVLDDMVSGISQDGNHTDFKYDNGEIKCFDNTSSDGCAVLCSKYNDDGNNVLFAFNSESAKTAQIDVNYDVTALAFSENYISLLNSSDLTTYSTVDGKQAGVSPVSVEASQVVISGDTAVMRSASVLNSADITSTVSDVS